MQSTGLLKRRSTFSWVHVGDVDLAGSDGNDYASTTPHSQSCEKLSLKLVFKLWNPLHDWQEVGWKRRMFFWSENNVTDSLPANSPPSHSAHLELPTMALIRKFLNERGGMDWNSQTHTHLSRDLLGLFGPKMQHVRHKIDVCIPSSHYCCLCWRGELSLWWVVGLRACTMLIACVCVLMCVCVCVCVWRSREETKGALPWRNRELEAATRCLYIQTRRGEKSLGVTIQSDGSLKETYMFNLRLKIVFLFLLNQVWMLLMLKKHISFLVQLCIPPLSEELCISCCLFEELRLVSSRTPEPAPLTTMKSIITCQTSRLDVNDVNVWHGDVAWCHGVT